MNTSHRVTIGGVEYRTAREVTKGDIAEIRQRLRDGWTARDIFALKIAPQRIVLAVRRSMKRLPKCGCGRPGGHRGYCRVRRDG